MPRATIIPFLPPTAPPTKTRTTVSSVSRKPVRRTFMSEAEGTASPGSSRPIRAAARGSAAAPASLGLSPFEAVRRRGARPERVALAHGTLSALVLPDPDALLDALTQEEFDQSDGRMPYWATLWPSALALADVVLSAPVSGPISLAGLA